MDTKYITRYNNAWVSVFSLAQIADAYGKLLLHKNFSLHYAIATKCTMPCSQLFVELARLSFCCCLFFIHTADAYLHNVWRFKLQLQFALLNQLGTFVQHIQNAIVSVQPDAVFVQYICAISSSSFAIIHFINQSLHIIFKTDYTVWNALALSLSARKSKRIFLIVKMLPSIQWTQIDFIYNV